MAYDNTNRGALFKNDKQGNESRPDYKGKINVGGDEYFLSAWLQKAKSGATYMSLSVQKATGDKPEPKQKEFQPAAPADYNDDIPF